MATKECYEKINVSMMNVRKLYTKFTGTKMGSWSSPEAWQCRCWPCTARRGCRERQDHLPAYNQALTGVHLPVGKYHQKNCMYRHTKKNYKSTKCCSMRSISARTLLPRAVYRQCYSLDRRTFPLDTAPPPPRTIFCIRDFICYFGLFLYSNSEDINVALVKKILGGGVILL